MTTAEKAYVAVAESIVAEAAKVDVHPQVFFAGVLGAWVALTERNQGVETAEAVKRGLNRALSDMGEAR